MFLLACLCLCYPIYAQCIEDSSVSVIGLDKQKIKNVNNFSSISFNIFLGSKNRLIEAVLLSTHNMFWLRNNKMNYFGTHYYLKSCIFYICFGFFCKKSFEK